VTKTAIAIGGDVILNKGARVDGDAYAIGAKSYKRKEPQLAVQMAHLTISLMGKA
jgi:hypothetical protein